jgi:hypothetical protein
MYSWQDAAVWIVVAAALAYLWRKLGPAPRSAPAQLIRLQDVKRRSPRPPP